MTFTDHSFLFPPPVPPLYSSSAGLNFSIWGGLVVIQFSTIILNNLASLTAVAGQVRMRERTLWEEERAINLVMGPCTSHTRIDFLSELGLFGPDRRGGDV